MTFEKKIMVVASAPDKYVLEAIETSLLKQFDGKLFVFVNETKKASYIKGNYQICTFKGFISWHNYHFLKCLIKKKPYIQIVVCGNNYFHNNIVFPLFYVNYLFNRKAKIYIYNRFKNNELHLFNPNELFMFNDSPTIISTIMIIVLYIISNIFYFIII